jgi:hypothetical protein
VGLYSELMSSDDYDEMEILELSEEEEDDIQLIGSGERLSCCFCRGEQCFDTPVEALPKKGCLIGPFLSHLRQEVPACQLYARINCARSAPGLDLGARDTLPAEVLQDLEAQGYEGKLRCTMLHPLAFAEHFGEQLRIEHRRANINTCSQCKCGGATMGCAFTCCKASFHLGCATDAHLVLASPVMRLASSTRSTWLCLCAAHMKKGNNPVPQPRPGNVCVALQDVDEAYSKAYATFVEGCVDQTLAWPVSLAAPATGDQITVVFSDESTIVVDRRDLLLPLELPIREYMPLVQEEEEKEEEEDREAEMDDETAAADSSSDDEPLSKFKAASSKSDDDSDSDSAPLAAFRPEVLPKGTASRPAATRPSSSAAVPSRRAPAPKTGKIIIPKKRKRTADPDLRAAADEKTAAAQRKKASEDPSQPASSAAFSIPKKVRSGGTWTAGPKGCPSTWLAAGRYHGMLYGWYYLPVGSPVVTPSPSTLALFYGPFLTPEAAAEKRYASRYKSSEPQVEKVGEFRAPEPTCMSRMMKQMKAPSGSLKDDPKKKEHFEKPTSITSSKTSSSETSTGGTCKTKLNSSLTKSTPSAITKTSATTTTPPTAPKMTSKGKDKTLQKSDPQPQRARSVAGPTVAEAMAAAAADDRSVGVDTARNGAPEQECEVVTQIPSKKKGLNVSIKTNHNKEHVPSKEWLELLERERNPHLQFQQLHVEVAETERIDESEESSSSDEDPVPFSRSSRAVDSNSSGTGGPDKLPDSSKQASASTAHTCARGAGAGEHIGAAEEPEDSCKAVILLTDSTTVLARTCLKDFGARFKRRNFTKLCDKRVGIIAGRPLVHWCRADSLAAADHNGQEANQGLLRGVVIGALTDSSATTLVLGVETPPASKPKRCVRFCEYGLAPQG